MNQNISPATIGLEAASVRETRKSTLALLLPSVIQHLLTLDHSAALLFESAANARRKDKAIQGLFARQKEAIDSLAVLFNLQIGTLLYSGYALRAGHRVNLTPDQAKDYLVHPTKTSVPDAQVLIASAAVYTLKGRLLLPGYLANPSDKLEDLGLAIPINQLRLDSYFVENQI